MGQILQVCDVRDRWGLNPLELSLLLKYLVTHMGFLSFCMSHKLVTRQDLRKVISFQPLADPDLPRTVRANPYV